MEKPNIEEYVRPNVKEDSEYEIQTIKTSGVVKQRRCTDALCIIIFIAHWVLFILVTAWGAMDANPVKLYKPRDFTGAYCGVEKQWNKGPNLVAQSKMTYMMNVSSSVDVIAKQLMCSSATSSFLMSADGLGDKDLLDQYLCACCLRPCESCSGSLYLGGDLTDPAQVKETISERMLDLTGMSNAGDLFSPSGANGDFFTTIWDKADQFFTKVCLPDCNNDYSSLDASSRTYVYSPDADSKLLSAWKFLANNTQSPQNIKDAIGSEFSFKALPANICPYAASRCVPFPGVKFAEVSLGYCTFEMAGEVIDAVGAVAASIFETAGGDAFVGSATDTFGLWVGDFEKSLDTFCVVAVLCFVIGLIYLVLLRHTVKFCVWFAVFVALLCFVLGGFMAYVRSSQCNDVGFFQSGQQIGVAVVVAGTNAAVNTVSGNQGPSEDCYGDCADYRGVQQRTRSGKTCQSWGTDSPHALAATYSNDTYPDSDLRKNYCRNPYNDPTMKASAIWCFTTDVEIPWEECIPVGIITGTCKNGYAIPGENARFALEICSYVLWGIAGIWILMVLCFVQRIRLAIALNQVAAQFVAQTPRILMVPIVQAIGSIVWVLAWVLSASFLISQVPDDYTPMGSFASYSVAYGTVDMAGTCNDIWPQGSVWKEDHDCAMVNDIPNCWRCYPPRYIIDWRFAYSFFSFLWNNAFQVALGQCVIAGAVGIWFFTPNSEKGKLGGCQALGTANWNAWRYHLGSLAFGSFIIALVQFIRYVMKYFEKQAEASKNRAMACILRITQCILLCFERFIEFLNKNAYIQIAIRGTNFCTSAKKAFMVIAQNFIRFGIIAVLGSVIHFIGYIFIMAATVIVGYFLLREMHSEISPVIPLIIYGAMAAMVGFLYMNVFGLAVDTCLQCVIFAEEKCPDGDFVPDALRSVIDKSNLDRVAL